MVKRAQFLVHLRSALFDDEVNAFEIQFEVTYPLQNTCSRGRGGEAGLTPSVSQVDHFDCT